MPAITREAVTIAGEITAWRAVRDGWGYGRLRTADALVSFTGTLIGVGIGDRVELDGVWDEHERFGRQVKVRSCTVQRPDTPAGIVAWLRSTLPDVGPGRAQTLVDRFGAELWDVIEQTPERLGEIDGLTAERIARIVKAYAANRESRDEMVKLRGWGLTDAQIARCVDAWCRAEGPGTQQIRPLGHVVERVHDNPYDLSRCVFGFGFKRADKVALKVGIAPDSPVRIAAGVEHVLDEASGAGHCYLPGKVLQSEAAKLIGVQLDPVADAIRACVTSGAIVRRAWRYYPRRLEQAENRCVEQLGALVERGKGADHHAEATRHHA